MRADIQKIIEHPEQMIKKKTIWDKIKSIFKKD